jgi:hypothetical protein
MARVRLLIAGAAVTLIASAAPLAAGTEPRFARTAEQALDAGA